MGEKCPHSATTVVGLDPKTLAIANEAIRSFRAIDPKTLTLASDALRTFRQINPGAIKATKALSSITHTSSTPALRRPQIDSIQGASRPEQAK